MRLSSGTRAYLRARRTGARPGDTWFSDLINRLLADRREARAMRAKGYERIDGAWTFNRGVVTGFAIVDAVVSGNRRDIWVKVDRAAR